MREDGGGEGEGEGGREEETFSRHENPNPDGGDESVQTAQQEAGQQEQADGVQQEEEKVPGEIEAEEIPI